MQPTTDTPLARMLAYASCRAPRGFLRQALSQASLDASVVENRLLRGRGPSPMVTRPSRARPSLEVVRPAPASEPPPAIEAPSPTSSEAASEALELIVLDAGARKVCTSSDDAYVLMSALEAGIDMPFSCALGGCGSCKVRLVEGEYEMDDPNCLTDEERAEGFVLTCVGRARSRCTLEIVR